MTLPELLLFALIFAIGTAIGSFLNVCIYRVPAGESIVFPPSRCPRCQTAIRWYQNIPILSFLLLGGRCARCRVLIPYRYPFVEALSGGLFLLVFWRFGWHPATLVYWIFIAALVTITFIDFDHQIIPDVISLPGIVVGLVATFWVPWLAWSDALLGIVLGGGSLWLVAFCYERLTKTEGMGFGDVKLLAMIGAFLGWKAIFPVIFFASLAGTLVGLPLMWLRGADGKLAIPFGPFLALGALTYLFWGVQLLNWYFRLGKG